MDKVLAMIMAGGRGQRMGELCKSKPKPALPFAGNYRVIDFSLSNCLNSQIQDIAILTGYQRSYLGSYLRRWHLANAPDKNLTVREPESGNYLGTADAVYQNLGQVVECDAENVLVLAADHVYQMDYREMIAFHKAVKADVTVGVVQVPLERASQFGLVKIGPDYRIIDFMEKPARPQSNLASMGIYVFNSWILQKRLVEDATQPDSIHDFGHVILPKMVKRDRMFAFKFKGYWRDIGTPVAYHQANLDLVYQNPSLRLEGVWPVYPCDKDYRPARVERNSNIKSSIIGANCVIKGCVENSILSPGVWIGEGAVIKDSVIMANVYIDRFSLVSHSILDEGAMIGEHCNIGAEPDFLHGLSEITVVAQNIRVPSYSSVGSSVKTSGKTILAEESTKFNCLPEPAVS